MFKQDDHRICFIGDSFVNGTCDPECLGWTGRLSVRARRDGYNLTHYNLGVRRETSLDIAVRWEQECEVRLPPFAQAYVVFSFGVNDTTEEGGKTRVAQSRTLETAQEILEIAQKRYPVLMVGPLPVGDMVQNARSQQLSQALETVALDVGVPYLPVYERMVNDSAWMREVNENDDSHPGAGGYGNLAELIYNWEHWWFKA